VEVFDMDLAATKVILQLVGLEVTVNLLET
jgi:hypothetical protein